MISGAYYLDSDGYPRAEFGPLYEELGCFLVDDVQRSPETCDMLFAICEDIKSGKQKEWQGTGNAHTVTITAEGVHVEHEFSDSYSPCDLSIGEFIDVLSRWKQLIGP